MGEIVIRGARENNLKGIDLELPRDQLVVITGPSGSGKSSLAFDTIYAEGQRRYVESLSAYARRFLDRQSRPDVDTIEGLSPAISIEQRRLGKNPRSTVGTVTEIHDYLRLLFARVGRAHCYSCGDRLERQSVQEMVARLDQLPEGARLAVLAPLVRGRRGAFRGTFEQLRRDGFTRVAVDGELHDLDREPALDPQREHTIELYVDRLLRKPAARGRLAESIELALKLAGGLVKIDTGDGEGAVFSERFACHRCGIDYPELTPRLFSFNNPDGACPRCSGLGVLLEFDESLVVPDPRLSLGEGAVAPWARRNAAHYQQLLAQLAELYDFSLVAPFGELPLSIRQLILRGSGDRELKFHFERGGRRRSYRRPFEGVIPNLERRLAEQQRKRREAGSSEDEQFDGVVDAFQRFMRRRSCPECGGTRLRREATSVRIDRWSIADVAALNVDAALAFFNGLELAGNERLIADKIVAEIVNRLSFLSGVGVGYLGLDRSAATLSGGESQRVRLATQIGAALVGVLYILDEPSIGLHPRDHRRLLLTLERLRDRGNTVLVVEHDEATIRAADHVVDLGPGAGDHGGEVVAAGTVEDLIAAPRSVTGQFLGGQRRIDASQRRRRGKGQLLLSGAAHNNLAQIDVAFPLGTFTCVTGVSGSGKSSLVVDTLLPALRAELHNAGGAAGAHRGLQGSAALDKAIAIDQRPIGRTPRSNPATYTGVFAQIRELFAGLPESRVRGYRAGRFSFNVKGGRCEACRGDGIIRIEMHFLPDIFVTCEVCGGHRYNEETLRVKYKGRSIADLLEMSVSEACELLGNVPRVRERLATLEEVGLGYLRLGQPANTLSGGEAQRVKLSKELSRRATGRTFYVLDEPTTGLHLADIELLLRVLHRLVDAGNTVVVIEHHLDVIRGADHVIDLGPEGGEGGGELVACGTPEEVAAVAGSHTGRCLQQVLAEGER